MISVSEFREAKPAFTDDTKWPNDLVQMSLDEADAETGGRGWGAFESVTSNFKRRGVITYASHWLASIYPFGHEKPKTGAASQLTSKSVGDESAAFSQVDMSKLSAGDAWFLSTVYGQSFLRLRKRAGMGAMAV